MFKSSLKILALTSVVFAGACSLDSPTKITDKRVQVEHERFVEDTTVEDFDSHEVAALAQHYARHGSGPLDLTVTYDPQSSTATAMNASAKAAKLADDLRANGVDNVKTNILPVKSSHVSKVLITYDGFNALAPDDCEMISGYHNRGTDADPDYEMGCSVDTLFAKQIARPKDLYGQADTNTTSDGRRASNITEIYRTGAPSAELSGENASGDQ